MAANEKHRKQLIRERLPGLVEQILLPPTAGKVELNRHTCFIE